MCFACRAFGCATKLTFPLATLPVADTAGVRLVRCKRSGFSLYFRQVEQVNFLKSSDGRLGSSLPSGSARIAGGSGREQTSLDITRPQVSTEPSIIGRFGPSRRAYRLKEL